MAASGRFMARRGQWREAESHLRRAQAIAPLYPKPWVNLGNLLLERRQPAEAFFGGRLARLRAVKRLVDPTRVIRSNHPVG